MWALALVALDPKEGSMMETTGLAIAGRRISVPRLFKRLLQIAVVLGLTGAVLFVIIVSNGMLAGRQPSLQAGVNMWLAFVKRPEIQLTAVITAVVAVLFVYWQRNQERRASGSGARRVES
jgi:hypothetical protein